MLLAARALAVLHYRQGLSFRVVLHDVANAEAAGDVPKQGALLADVRNPPAHDASLAAATHSRRPIMGTGWRAAIVPSPPTTGPATLPHQRLLWIREAYMLANVLRLTTSASRKTDSSAEFGPPGAYAVFGTDTAGLPVAAFTDPSGEPDVP